MPFADPAARTTLILRHWELASTAAEHLCADILRLDGFEGIDPQLRDPADYAALRRADAGDPDGLEDLVSLAVATF